MARREWLVAVGIVALAAGTAALTVARAGDTPEADKNGKEVHKVVIFRSGGSWLGVQIADVDASRAKELGLKEEMGAEVQSVSPGSPAEEAGLKEGDVITEYQGTRIEGVTQLTRLVRETPAGRNAAVKFVRDGAPRTVQVKVGERDHEHDADMEKHIEVMGGPHGFAKMWHQSEDGDTPNVDVESLDDLPNLINVPGMMGGRPRLGVNVDNVGQQLAEYFGIKQGHGVLVTSVTKDSPGATAGLKAGDVIVKVDDESIGDVSDLHMALRDRRDKDVRLTIVRDRREQTVTVPPAPHRSSDKSSRKGSGFSWAPADQETIQAHIREAQMAAAQAAAQSPEVQRQIQEALRQAREAARQAAERATGTLRQMQDDAESEPAGDDSVENKPAPDQEREDIKRAVEEARRIRMGMPSTGGTGGD
ncbi:MAG TPA: PDZ domain-containing protein [Patescibacteria group bacterium]|nr:PDZ domain-containing protein [Patescibacteria group bacterium]